jgi:hypothetical protein
VLLGLLRNPVARSGDGGHVALAQHLPDSFIWEFIAYCAGTCSILIIGSAAGVAATVRDPDNPMGRAPVVILTSR